MHSLSVRSSTWYRSKLSAILVTCFFHHFYIVLIHTFSPCLTYADIVRMFSPRTITMIVFIILYENENNIHRGRFYNTGGKMLRKSSSSLIKCTGNTPGTVLLHFVLLIIDLQFSKMLTIPYTTVMNFSLFHLLPKFVHIVYHPIVFYLFLQIGPIPICFQLRNN